MKKILVQTAGGFTYVDDSNMQVVAHDRPCVVAATPFIKTRIADGRIELLGELGDDAVDADFRATLAAAEGDVELAVASFIAEKPAPEPAPKKPASKKAPKPEADA